MSTENITWIGRGGPVYLRFIELSDIDQGWLRWINDLEVTGYLASSKARTRRDLEDYYWQSQPPSAYMFAVCEKGSDRYVGNARLGSVDRENMKAVSGMLIGNSADRGRGIGTECHLVLLHYAFHHLRLNRVQSTVNVDNAAVIRKNEKIGIKREGVLRQFARKENAFCDVVLFSILLHEFNEMYGDADTWAELCPSCTRE